MASTSISVCMDKGESLIATAHEAFTAGVGHHGWVKLKTGTGTITLHVCSVEYAYRLAEAINAANLEPSIEEAA